jgi:N-acetylglucosamine malate deacetylase 2
LRFLGIRDKLLEIQPMDKLAETVLHHMLDVKPDAVITFHESLGGHPDHCTIGTATQKAFKMYTEQSGQILKSRLFYLCWQSVAQNPREHGLVAEQITKIEVKPYNIYKLKAFRAHRTQSQIDDWVWKRDEISLRRFSAHEYFIQAHEPYKGKKGIITGEKQ